jgi:hypothetical protein
MTELKRYPTDEVDVITKPELVVILELKRFVETKLDRLAEETILWEDERIKLCKREEWCK